MHVVPHPEDQAQKVRQQRTDAFGRLGWRLRVRDPRAERQPEKTFYGTYDEAVRELVKFEAELAVQTTPVDKEARTITLGRFAERWAERYAWKHQPRGEYKGEARRYSTFAGKVAVCQAYVLKMIDPSRRLSSITTDDLVSAIAALKLENGKPASSYTKETTASVVKLMFRDAVSMGLLKANTAESVPSAWGGDSGRRRAIIPSMLDLEKLATALDKIWPLPVWAADLAGPNGEGRGDILRFAAYTGMRWEEIAALKADAVDMAHRSIRVQDTATESGGRREVRRGSNGENAGKTAAATRVLVVVNQAVDVIERLDAIRRRGLALEPERERRRQARGVKRPPSLPLEERWTLLLPGETGGYMSYGHWGKKLEKAQQLSGVDLTIHELRHIAASILIASGVKDSAIQEQMGHTSVTFTRRKYGHVFTADRRELADRISQKIDVLTEAEIAADQQNNPEAW